MSWLNRVLKSPWSRTPPPGPRLPEGDGYLAALVNFRYLASAVWTTAQAVAILDGSADGGR